MVTKTTIDLNKPEAIDDTRKPTPSAMDAEQTTPPSGVAKVIVPNPMPIAPEEETDSEIGEKAETVVKPTPTQTQPDTETATVTTAPKDIPAGMIFMPGVRTRDIVAGFTDLTLLLAHKASDGSLAELLRGVGAKKPHLRLVSNVRFDLK